MDVREFVRERITRYYRADEVNCAVATLKILGERFEVDISRQVLDAAVGMNGAGQYRAQCGLVEGAVMFLGVMGREQGLDDDSIMELSRAYAEAFEKRFGSLSCRVLRPEGFDPDNPPHICEPLSVDAVVFDIKFIERLQRQPPDNL